MVYESLCACVFNTFATTQENRLLHERKEAEKRCNVKMWAERRLQKVRANDSFLSDDKHKQLQEGDTGVDKSKRARDPLPDVMALEPSKRWTVR